MGTITSTNDGSATITGDAPDTGKRNAWQIKGSAPKVCRVLQIAKIRKQTLADVCTDLEKLKLCHRAPTQQDLATFVSRVNAGGKTAPTGSAPWQNVLTMLGYVGPVKSSKKLSAAVQSSIIDAAYADELSAEELATMNAELAAPLA